MYQIIVKNISKLIMISILCIAISIKNTNAATSSILIDAKTGHVISSQRADTLRYPASLTKIMTLYITFDALEKGLIKLDDKFPVSRNAENRSPSKLGLRKGQTIRVEDAVMALVVKSANDCATVLAEGLGYTEANFAKTMTSVARELGMKSTTFKNASGLPNRAQKTTARDMALLGSAMYHHFPQYYHLFSAKKFKYKDRTYYTHNHLLKNFKGADGMKTGYTRASGFNIVTSAKRNGQRVIAVTMGHNTAKLRDKKIAILMATGLKKLEIANKLETSNLYASIETPANIAISAAEPNKKVQQNFSIQVGAFSNYAKARNYAALIKNGFKNIPSHKSIDIEPIQKGAAVIYRSKITSFAKNEADNICNKLKRSNKSCIVVANNNNELVLAQNTHDRIRR